MTVIQTRFKSNGTLYLPACKQNRISEHHFAPGRIDSSVQSGVDLPNHLPEQYTVYMLSPVRVVEWTEFPVESVRIIKVKFPDESILALIEYIGEDKGPVVELHYDMPLRVFCTLIFNAQPISYYPRLPKALKVICIKCKF